MTITAALRADPQLFSATIPVLAERHWCSPGAVTLARRLERAARLAAGEPVPPIKRGRPRTSAAPRTPARWRLERARAVAWLRAQGLGDAADRIEAGEHVGSAP